MNETEARDAGSWVAVKNFVEGIWREKYPQVSPKILPEWLVTTLSDTVRKELETVLYDTIKLAIVETATHKLEALGVEGTTQNGGTR